MMRAGFPDVRWTLEETVTEGDTVAARFTMRGTHQGEFFGIPASGKTISVQAMNFYYLANGKIIKERGQPDLLGVMQQIGAVAMTAGLAAFVVVRLALSGLVDRLVPAQRLEVAPDHPMTVHQDGSLVIGDGWLDAAGQPVSSDKAAALIQACKSTPAGTSNTQEGYLACLPQSGLAKRYADFIPESQAWQVHLVDASIFGGLALLLLVGTAWVLRRQS
jgi:SnoaL-like polyketide cyclase